MSAKIAVICLVLPLLASCGPRASDLVSKQKLLEEAQQKSSFLSTEENEFLVHVNELRAETGQSLLEVHPTLQAAAEGHSEYMNQNSILTHVEPSPNESSSDRVSNLGGRFATVGENVAYGNTSGEKTFDQWYSSSGHYRNMVSSSYRYIGIARSGIYWTAVFAGSPL